MHAHTCAHAQAGTHTHSHSHTHKNYQTTKLPPPLPHKVRTPSEDKHSQSTYLVQHSSNKGARFQTTAKNVTAAGPYAMNTHPKNNTSVILAPETATHRPETVCAHFVLCASARTTDHHQLSSKTVAMADTVRFQYCWVHVVLFPPSDTWRARTHAHAPAATHACRRAWTDATTSAAARHLPRDGALIDPRLAAPRAPSWCGP